MFAARVSTQGEQTLDDVDADRLRPPGLINFLMRDRHGSPFEHNSMTFYVQAPIFVFREFMRHRIASYNEESGRYRELRPVFYVPGPERKPRAAGQARRLRVRRGHPRAVRAAVDATDEASVRQAYEAYLAMLDAGVAREVAADGPAGASTRRCT